MNISKGKVNRPQRVVIYGVESVGKTTFAAQFPNPLFLDVEGGTAHLDVARVEVGAWNELLSCIEKCKATEFKTIVLDSIDWAERLCIEAFLEETKKKSIEDIPYGKGWIQVAERMSRFLNDLDGIIAAGKNIVLVGHSHVKRVEPPDLMTAYDRYELKLTKYTVPLVKEWADELWFFRFETKVVESEGGKGKGIGGKNRIILTTHSAAYDAKTRSGLDEKLPLEWQSVAHLFPQGNIAPVVQTVVDDVLANVLKVRSEDATAFLVARGVIQAGQTWQDAPEDYVSRIRKNPERFIESVDAWMEEQK